MFLPVTQLRNAMMKAFEKHLFCPEGDVETFLHSVDLSDGDSLEEYPEE